MPIVDHAETGRVDQQEFGAPFEVKTVKALSTEHRSQMVNQLFLCDWKDFASQPFRPWFVGFLRDVGAPLDVHLYEAATTHYFGSGVEEVEIRVDGQTVGLQRVRLATPGWALRVTTLSA